MGAYRIAAIPGDGIGQEVIAAGLQVLEALQARAPELQLDLSLRRDLGEHLTLSVWGRNILADAHVENYNQFGWVSFPHQVHRTFGAGLLYQY